MKTITKIIVAIAFSLPALMNAQSAGPSAPASSEAPKSSVYEEVRYYYFPNLQAYFDTKTAVYLYKENGEWVEAEQLSPTVRGYSVKNGQYVMLKDYFGEEPYELLEQHKAKYPADFSSRPKRGTTAVAVN